MPKATFKGFESNQKAGQNGLRSIDSILQMIVIKNTKKI